MRSYSALLLFETVYDGYVPVGTNMSTLAQQLFSPVLPVVSGDCGTLLGDVADVNFETEGRVELATGVPITADRVSYLLREGHYKVKTRSLSTCTAPDGVCVKCYKASRPLATTPAVGSNVTILPMYERGSEVIAMAKAGRSFHLTLDRAFYESLVVIVNGVTQPTSAYTISGNLVTMTATLAADSHVVVRYLSESRAPFLLWLASTYSGHLLGAKPLPSPMLPVRPSLLRDNIAGSLLELAVEEAKESTVIPPNMLEYLSNTHDSLEQALFLTALHAIYDNVQQ